MSKMKLPIGTPTTEEVREHLERLRVADDGEDPVGHLHRQVILRGLSGSVLPLAEERDVLRTERDALVAHVEGLSVANEAACAEVERLRAVLCVCADHATHALRYETVQAHVPGSAYGQVLAIQQKAEKALAEAPPVARGESWGIYDAQRSGWWPRSFSTREAAQAHYDKCKGPGSQCVVRELKTEGV